VGYDLDPFVALYRAGTLHARQATFTEAAPEVRWRAHDYDELVARDK